MLRSLDLHPETPGQRTPGTLEARIGILTTSMNLGDSVGVPLAYASAFCPIPNPAPLAMVIYRFGYLASVHACPIWYVSSICD